MTGRLLQRDALTDAERDGMLALMKEFFLGVNAAQFERDIAEKNWVILLEDNGRLRGFSTMQLYTTSVGGTPIRVIYSGDTIVHRDAWGSSALARTWLEIVRKWQSDVPLYWLLITSGFRTYRFLPVFWKEFWPRYEAVQRPQLLDALAKERFGKQFDASNGLVRFAAPQVLRNGLKEIPPSRLIDPHVKFFAQANIDHAHGDELVCLCPLTQANQTPAGRRLVAL
jgi:hypothetical protein